MAAIPPNYTYYGQNKVADLIAGYCGDNRVTDVVNAQLTAQSINFASPAHACRGLKLRWWRQFIDGQQLDPWVFDTGSHTQGKRKEPGYLASGLAASNFASEHIHKPITIKRYKEIHRRACQHMKGEANSTLITSKEAGKFKIPGFTPNAYFILYQYLPIDEFHSIVDDFYDCKEIVELIGPKRDQYIRDNGLTEKQFNKKRIEAAVWLRDFEMKVKRKIKEINKYIYYRSLRLGCSKSVATLVIDDGIIVCEYGCPQKEVEKVMRNLLKEYNENLAVAKTMKEKIIIVADFYQMCEWIHPFPDGQGRTDLITLAGELSRIGSNPAILYYPYVSTFCLLEDWVPYLEEGIKVWQEELQHPSDRKERSI